jgi:putative ABC transport system substrate-binding protein
LAAKNRIPALYTLRLFIEIGGLIAYSFDLEEMARSAADKIVQIPNGTNPGDIPISQVTRYEVAINLKTAKTLGLELPATLLASAALVIE